MRALPLVILFASTLSGQSQAVLSALSTGSYFPLDIGDRWVYREDTRFATAAYQTWRVDRSAVQNGQTYTVVAIEGPGVQYAESWFRVDTSGRIYLLTGTGDQLFLDPTVVGPAVPGGVPGMLDFISKGGPYTSAAGTFPDTISYTNRYGLDVENGILARGVGLLTSTTLLQTGSSGGPDLMRTLVEADVAGIHFPEASASISLGIEKLTLNVSDRQVTNCAVPCYFTACYLAPGADQPGTYKPCARTRVELRNWPANLSRTVRLQLLAPDGSAVFDQTVALDSAPVASVSFLQVPLYSTPNAPLPPGSYQLAARSSDGAAQSSIAVQIQ